MASTVPFIISTKLSQPGVYGTSFLLVLAVSPLPRSPNGVVHDGSGCWYRNMRGQYRRSVAVTTMTYVTILTMARVVAVGCLVAHDVAHTLLLYCYQSDPVSDGVKSSLCIALMLDNT